MIRNGKNLFQHYKEMQRLLWPNHDHHRWSDLCLESILNNSVTVLMGPASSGKTHYAALYALCDMWAWPECTGILVSSTDMRGLKMRIWAEIAKLYNEAKEVYPDLPGKYFPSVPAISMDDIEEGQMRDLRNGVIGVPCKSGQTWLGLGSYVGFKNKRVRLLADECFVAGTLVDTPMGPRSIETIKVGDVVYSAAGIDTVKATSKRSSTTIVTVRTIDGRKLRCTPNHPFLTSAGWVRAIDLNQATYILSAHEAMQVLRRGYLGVQNILFRCLSREMVHANTGRSGKVLHKGKSRKNLSWEKALVQSESVGERGVPKKGVGKSVAITTGDDCQDEGHTEEDWSQADHPWRKRNWSNQSGETSFGSIRISEKQFPNQNWRKERKWISAELQSGHCIPGNQTCCGGRRRQSLSFSQDRSGRKEDRKTHGAWVDSVEIQEQENCGGNGCSRGGVEVYNLQVERHPSYSVAGFLVHNCSLMQHSFLDSISNLAHNPSFKGVFMGNPHESIDPLGRAGEPEEGWSAQEEPEKTTVWKTRFMNGVCVNLVGTDSPNFDFPQDRSPKYPYLIHKGTIDSTEKFYGKDSMQYYSMCKGVMKVGLQGHRIITRELCAQNHAMDQAVWKDNERTRVYGVDIAYGGVGGDRCVGIMLEFGIDQDGRQLVQMTMPDMIPVSIREEKIPEDQIAEYVHRRLRQLNIPVKNCFYDSTGRGSVGSSFAKVFGHDIPVPIEFGARPTMRPVRMDLYLYDEREHRRRLKRCEEHYSKFVTELWYSVRYAIEAGQFRGMTEDVMYEGCIREWMTVAGNKIEVESKADTKERMGRSPDLFDALVIAFEGARQRGFGISRLGGEVFTENSGRSALDELARKWHKTERAKRLTYA